MQDLAARMFPRHGDELPRSIEPHGFVPQRSEVAEIAPGSATEIKDSIGWITLYGIEECRVILADIVVLRTVPEGWGEPIVKRDRRLTEAADLFRVMWFFCPADQDRPPVSRSIPSAMAVPPTLLMDLLLRQTSRTVRLPGSGGPVSRRN